MNNKEFQAIENLFPGTAFPVINLSPVQPHDIAMIATWVAHAKVNRWLDMGNGRQSLSQLQLYALLTSAKTHARLFGLPQQPPVGIICLNDIDNMMGTAEAWIARGVYSHGPSNVSVSAGLAMLATAFFDLNREVVGTWVVDTNHHSIRVHRMLGMQEVGRQRSRHIMNGRRHDRILFDMTKEEFCNRYPDVPSENGITFRSIASNDVAISYQNAACA